MQPPFRVGNRRHKARCADQPLPYHRRGPLLTKGEAAFYRVLRLAVGRYYHVAFKARLADIITCSESAWDAGFGHLIARHHVDFVLCDYRTTEVIAAIELDDRSHAKASRRRRDAFVNDALEAAGIPLVRIRASARYEVSDLNAVIAGACRGKGGQECSPHDRAMAGASPHDRADLDTPKNGGGRA